MRSPEELAGHDGFEKEWHHIRDSLHTALELGDIDAARRLVVASAWWAHSRARLEVGGWVSTVLEATTRTDDVHRPALLMVACAFQFLRGELVGLTELVAEARAEVERLELAGEPWIPYVEAHFTTLDTDTKAAAYREIRRWAEAAEDPFWTAIADGMVGEGLAISLDAGRLDPEAASRAVDRIRRISAASEHGGRSGRTARGRYTEGLALRSIDPDGAALALRRAMEIADRLELTELSGAASGALAVHLTQHQRPLAAAAVLARAMEAARRRGAFGTLQVAALRAPLTLIALGRPLAAVTVLATVHAVRADDVSINQAMDDGTESRASKPTRPTCSATPRCAGSWRGPSPSPSTT